jgi:peptidyl-prolyl cis-trans isomerase D
MLQKIRDRISGWFAAVFLGAIAVVFIFWGIQFESTVTNEAASVNGEDIPARLVQQAWQDRQTELHQQVRDELPPDLVRAEQQQLVDGFIDRELLVQRARKSGYRVSDRELAETLQQIPALQVDGQFSRDRYTALLRQQGRSEAEFEREFRRDLETNQLRNSIALSSFVTPTEMQRRIALEGELRDVAYAVIPTAGFAANVEVTPEAVAAHYEKNRTQYVTPETVALQYLKLDLADIAGNVQVTEENLHKYYEETAARLETPERRKASHILVESGGDDAAAKNEAAELAARAKGGEDFAALARAHSNDLGSRSGGGDLGWATREAYVKEFSDALFAMQKEGEITGPVRTQFGYHIIRLDGIEAPHVRSFEEVRAELEPEYRREVAQNEFYEKSQQLADESFAALSELDSVAKKLGLPLQTVDGFTRQGGGALGNDRKVIEAAFSDEVLQDRQNSQPIQLGEDSVVVLRVADHQPSKQRPLDEVRDEIAAELREEGARKAAAEAAAALARRIDAGEPLGAVAVSAGATATVRQTVDRQGRSDANGTPMPPELVKAVFQAPRPAGEGKTSVGTATLASGDQAVFVVSDVRPGKLEGTAAEAQLPLRAQQTAQIQAAVEFGAYLDELRRTAKIKRNERLFATE